MCQTLDLDFRFTLDLDMQGESIFTAGIHYFFIELLTSFHIFSLYLTEFSSNAWHHNT